MSVEAQTAEQLAEELGEGPSGLACERRRHFVCLHSLRSLDHCLKQNVLSRRV
jgi:hypothetical protein